MINGRVERCADNIMRRIVPRTGTHVGPGEAQSGTLAGPKSYSLSQHFSLYIRLSEVRRFPEKRTRRSYSARGPLLLSIVIFSVYVHLSCRVCALPLFGENAICPSEGLNG